MQQSPWGVLRTLQFRTFPRRGRALPSVLRKGRQIVAGNSAINAPRVCQSATERRIVGKQIAFGEILFFSNPHDDDYLRR
jgi:hypothetical protein